MSAPYTSNENRLADVIAAIQAMGEYPFHMTSFAKWAEQISGDAARDMYWKSIFEQHPEFFRLDRTRLLVSLVWRRQKPKRFDPDLSRLLTINEVEMLPADYRLTRAPLSAEDIKALIDTAIAMHASEVGLQRSKKWWVPLAASGGALLGALIGANVG